MKKLLMGSVAALSVAVTISSAQSADLVNVPTGYDWSGLYVGVHGGGAWTDPSGVFDSGGAPGGPFDLSTFDINGGLLGGHVGYNWQINQLVLGAEGDLSAVFASDSQTTEYTFSNSLEHLATVRGRLGFALDQFMIYGTAGWAYAGFDASVSGQGFAPDSNISFNDSGWVYGGGIEYGTSMWLLRIEYLHYDVDVTRSLDGALGDGDGGDFVRYDGIDVVRAGVSFRF